MNFGGFATPERNLVFDINDFDETLRAPFEWDVKWLAASFVIPARWRGSGAIRHHSRMSTLPALTVVAGALVGARRPQSSATRCSRRRVEDLRPPRACSCSR
jgi:uncharacterized protein (DUF2252 family)